MTHEKIGIVWNPTKVSEDDLRQAFAAAFDEAEAAWYETTADDPGTQMAEDAVAADCTTVIAAGGDGTVRAVAEVLAGTEVSLGIIPQGTGNLLARNLEIPLNSIPAAMERIAAGETRQIDLGWVRTGESERAFAVMVGFGLDAQMLVETDDDLKDRAGWLAYVEAMGRALAGTELLGASLTVDDDEPVRMETHTFIVGNCGMLQGGIRLLPDAELDDGRLDVLSVSSEGPLQWLDTLKSVIWDNGIRRLFGDDEATSTETADHLSVTRLSVNLDTPVAFEIDGEEVGDVDAFEIRVDPGALRVS